MVPSLAPNLRDPAAVLERASTSMLLNEPTRAARALHLRSIAPTKQRRPMAIVRLVEWLVRLQGEPLAEAPDARNMKQRLKRLAGCEGSGGDVLLSTVGLSALGACAMAALEWAAATSTT